MAALKHSDDASQRLPEHELEALREARRARQEPVVQASLHVQHLTRIRDCCTELRSIQSLAAVARYLSGLVSALRDYFVLDKVHDFLEGDHFFPVTRSCFEILERSGDVDGVATLLEKWESSEHAKEVLDDIRIRLVTRVRQLLRFDESIPAWTRRYLDELVRADPPDFLEDASDYRLLDTRGLPPQVAAELMAGVLWVDLESPPKSEKRRDEASADPSRDEQGSLIPFEFDLEPQGLTLTIKSVQLPAPIALEYRQGDRRDRVAFNSRVGRVLIEAAGAGYVREGQSRDASLSRARQALSGAVRDSLMLVEDSQQLIRFDRRVVLSKRLQVALRVRR